ncbi:uncharacterized protein M6B38_105245 [Iris pallida]|uniref:Uncharacterized protein n=1 Tax=Iris pallida TaxID=29817 RepID=A0AAX6DW33_IRIPA|nr:Uncharacterized protein M6B38_223395 [Iris pallida]KAJ6810881.1 uncharacterized protein M6B38_105245 [Iris pallida]
MYRYGLLDETQGQGKLDYVLALMVENFLERRLQTLVFKSGMAKSIHHARGPWTSTEAQFWLTMSVNMVRGTGMQCRSTLDCIGVVKVAVFDGLII